MGLDIRIPMGVMFLLLGAIITVYGLISDAKMYAEHSLGININLWWGLVLLLFGACMVGLAWRSSRRPAPPTSAPSSGEHGTSRMRGGH